MAVKDGVILLPGAGKVRNLTGITETRGSKSIRVACESPLKCSQRGFGKTSISKERLTETKLISDALWSDKNVASCPAKMSELSK